MRGKSKPEKLRERWFDEIRLVKEVTLTKQSNPRSVKNDQTIHGKNRNECEGRIVVNQRLHALEPDRTMSVRIPGRAKN